MIVARELDCGIGSRDFAAAGLSIMEKEKISSHKLSRRGHSRATKEHAMLTFKKMDL